MVDFFPIFFFNPKTESMFKQLQLADKYKLATSTQPLFYYDFWTHQTQDTATVSTCSVFSPWQLHKINHFVFYKTSLLLILLLTLSEPVTSLR